MPLCQIEEYAPRSRYPALRVGENQLNFLSLFHSLASKQEGFPVKEKCNTHAGQDISRAVMLIGALLCAPVWFIHLQIDLSHARKKWNASSVSTEAGAAHTRRTSPTLQKHRKNVSTCQIWVYMILNLAINIWTCISVVRECRLCYIYVILQVTRQQVLLFLLRALCTWVRGNFTHSYLHVGTHYAPTTCVTKRQNVALLTQFWHFWSPVTLRLKLCDQNK
jgi:hypothetical protein